MAAGNSVPLAGGDLRKPSVASSRRPSGSSFSWTASEPSLEEIAALEKLFPDVIQLPSVAIDQEIADWSQSGVIVRSLSRWVPAEAVIREFRRGGVAGGIQLISLAYRTFLIKFELPAAREAVLAQPWIVNGQPLAAEAWRPGFFPAEDALHQALLWIRLPKLPIEFWTEETLRAILSVAGQFMFMDPSTKERKRGGYARACVRVNLSQPLRPGARFRTNGNPFWQQFVYEHVEGICSHCGSLHLSGPCSSSKDPASSSEAPSFGPWMAALRIRRQGPVEVSSSRGRSEGTSGKAKMGPLVEEEGWQLPRKTSRRRVASVPSPLPGVFPSADPCREGCAVPVTVAEPYDVSTDSVLGSGGVKAPVNHPVSQKEPRDPRKPQARMSSKSPSQVDGFQFTVVASAALSELPPQLKEMPSGKLAANPFGLLGSDRWAGCPKIRKDANPASLKRARPAVSSGPRVISKNAKGKSRGPILGKAHSEPFDLPSGSDPPRPNCDHDEMVSSLKMAIRVETDVAAETDVVAMDLSRQSDSVVQDGCPSPKEDLVPQCLASGELTDMDLASANDGAHETP